MAGKQGGPDAGLEAALAAIDLELSAFDKFVAGDLPRAAVKIAQRRREGKVDQHLALSVSTLDMADRLVTKIGLPGRSQVVDLAVLGLYKAWLVQERRRRLRKAKEARSQ